MDKYENTKFKLDYRGNLFWLIFWIIIFFPIALVLLLTNSSVKINRVIYTIKYNGSQFWLGFWVFVFFPVAFVLLFVNGLSIEEEPVSDVIICDKCEMKSSELNSRPRD